MTKVLVTEGHLNDIAEAIRSKNGAATTYRPGDMAAAIQAIPTGGITPTGTKNITQNGTHDVMQYASANVNVPNSYAAADEGKVVSNGALVAQTSRNVTANGTYDTTTNDEVVVSVTPNLQSKTATQNGTITPDQGYDGLSSVVVNVSGGGSDPAVPSGYQEVQYLQCIDYQGVRLNAPIKGLLISVDISQDSISSSESGFAGYYASSALIAELYLRNGNTNAYSKTPDIDSVIRSGITAGTKHKVTYVFLQEIQSFNIGFYRSDRYPFSGKLYQAEITDPNGGTSLHMLLKPCYRKSDNEPGMYDVINDVFYTNVGSGSFGVGPDVN